MLLERLHVSIVGELAVAHGADGAVVRLDVILEFILTHFRRERERTHGTDLLRFASRVLESETQNNLFFLCFGIQ